MKRVIIFGLLLMMFSLAFAQDSSCDMQVSILNQDPIPGVPGEKMEIVFMLSGIDSRDCGSIEFEVLDEFPFKVLENSPSYYLIESGTFTKDFNTHKTIPIKFSIDKDALDGDNPIEVRWKSSKTIGGYSSKRFDIDIEDVRANFEVFVSEYDYQTKDITFEVLNTGKNDIEAVTIQVLNQDGIKINGADRENIGDLSSNEDTSAEFNMDVNTDKINLTISYSDSINVRRTIEKEVVFNSNLFESTKVIQKDNNWMLIVGGVLIILVIFFILRRRKKKNNTFTKK